MSTVLITGASFGLGADFAQLFAADKYELVLVARSEDRLIELKNQLEAKYKVTTNVIACDLANGHAAFTLKEALDKKGLSIDVLINNAGFGDFGLFAELDPVRQQHMIDLNVTTLTLLTRLLLPDMLKRKQGKILNVASTAAFQPGPLMAVYFATKSYVLSFSLALANELKGTGVTVTALCPGATETHFVKNANLDDSKLFKRMKPATSMEVAQYGVKALHNGKVVAVHGFINSLMAWSVRFFPLTWQTAVVRKIQEKV
ncbi:MAG: short-chain dehydrogenase/reductase [Chitinophagaceae bacterium]|nr:short-chain dehydrogenase/reductase [Chitinophagaceae bacterium]